MSSSESLPKEEVARRRALLREFQDASAAAEGELPPERWNYRKAACVLSTFDPETLRPLGGRQGEGGALRWLMEDCEVVAGTGRWMLKESVRREAIERLDFPGGLGEVLQCNPVENPDLLQQLITHYLEQYSGIEKVPHVIRRWEVPGHALRAPRSEFDRTGLEDADVLDRQLQVVRWFGPKVMGQESHNEYEQSLRHDLARARLLAPFRKLAGDTFRGRKAELGRLRAHIGVLDTSVRQRLSDVLERTRLWSGRRAPLLIHGPGGMGKSALVARFMLEHSRSVAFAYLDFDDPHINLDKPATLLMEMSRQLGLQYPGAPQEMLSHFEARCRRALNDERQRRAVGLSGDASAAESARQLWLPLVEEFGSRLVKLMLQDEERSKRFLLLFDTFEEVQYRNADLMRELNLFLKVLSERYAPLRVVLSGRAPEPQLEATDLALEELDRVSALSLLKASGVEVPSVRQGLYEQVGGNPLSLVLAAEVVHLEGAAEEGIRALTTKRLFFFAAREAVVQGQLYRRILEHVHDPVVRKLAHPGLILRRLTPEVIREVLAGPCGLGELSLSQAKALFEQLRREVSLVSLGADGALYHRPDVRSVMLAPLKQDQPEKVAAIHAAAVRYYEQRTDVASRAEELYHRLASAQPREQIEPRWMSGVEGYLRTAVDDLPAEARTYAASHLGLHLSPKVWARAELVDWERHTARRANDVLLNGEPLLALDFLRVRRERTPGSALYSIEARALILSKRFDKATRVIDDGIDSAGWGADPVETLKLFLLKAQLEAMHGERERAQTALEEADLIAVKRVGDLACLLPRMAMTYLWGVEQPRSPQFLFARKKLSDLLLQLPERDVYRAPQICLTAIDLLNNIEPLDESEPLKEMSNSLRHFLLRPSTLRQATGLSDPEKGEEASLDFVARLFAQSLFSSRPGYRTRGELLVPPSKANTKEFGPLFFLTAFVA
ncbi:ATP-binding protein [Myxococcus sp. NMCA1]|uniref:ATP-binding protein n=1 Tax=Myxococcus sp. NMCA1 TaxID=2996785 RepID=UPI0022869E3F|nr:AAA family ATPase [Myxococcus sp. NMCA1]WAM28266.1 AAA family ATPase [Myxococcus sp. NMCA1]